MRESLSKIEQAQLRDGLHRAVMATIQPCRRVDIPRLLDVLDIPDALDDPELSKAQYIESRLELVTPQSLMDGIEKFLHRHGGELSAELRFELEESLWAFAPSVDVPKRTRYDLARALDGVPLYIKASAFVDLVRRFWERETDFDSFFGDRRGSLIADVERHLVRNPDDWTVEHFFERVGAFDVSDRRFALFIEGLASSEVRPDETSQREFVDAVNSGIEGNGLELRDVDVDGGFPVFRFATIGNSTWRPKNLIFASSEKPDLRFRDAVNNDVEIVNGADKVLVYDRPFPAEGLRWRDLQEWWAEFHGLDEEQAKRSLYKRLLESLPKSSPPQKLLFECFFRSFSAHIQQLPALLPEVWLHWDPKTVRERGPDALARFRMDFLMLFPHEIRVVIEVDGRQHYASDSGHADPSRYAEMVRSDRELRLAGYEVYRFGAAELDATTGPDCVKDFFTMLFERYRVPLR